MRPTSKSGLRTIAVGAALIAALSGVSTAALADDVYSAIAFSTVNGKYGIAHDQASRALAEQQAMDDCRRQSGTDCVNAVYSKHCVALVVADKPIRYAASSGNSNARAVGRAFLSFQNTFSETGFLLLHFCNSQDNDY